METLPVTSVCRLSVLNEAWIIQSEVGELLIREEGLFIGNAEHPAIKAGQQYSQLVGGAEIPLRAGDKIVGTVIDSAGAFVVKKGQISLLRPEPALPVTALEMIEAILNADLDYHQKWAKRKETPAHEIVERFLLPSAKKSQYKNAIVRAVLNVTDHLSQQVYRFIGNDIMTIHMLKRRGGTLILTKHIDWRVTEYERLKAEGKIKEE